MLEGNSEVKVLQESITALKELHKAELEELKKEVEKQVHNVLIFMLIVSQPISVKNDS